MKSILFILLIAVTTNLHAQGTKKPPVFVLVHGAWHGGWAWQNVSADLREKGSIVYTPTLSGLGEHKNTLNRDIDLNTHINDIVNLIVMEDLHDVVLVGHSYAGAVIAGVADKIPERLSKLIFLDALIIRNGQSALSQTPKENQEYTAKAAEKDSGLTIPILTADYFGVTDPKDIKWVNERLAGQPYKTFTQPLVLNHPYGNHLPLFYIFCNNPILPPIKRFAEEVKNDRNWKYYTMNTGHDAMITTPHELATLLNNMLLL
jgi:pimeloyl-ACP methyl ester carboxylesterase